MKMKLRFIFSRLLMFAIIQKNLGITAEGNLKLLIAREIKWAIKYELNRFDAQTILFISR